jgi:hypothetical protein
MAADMDDDMTKPLSTLASAGILLGAIALLALSLGGCSAIAGAAAGGHSPQSSKTGAADAGGSKDAFTLSIGDCFNNPTSDIVTDVDTVACTAPHDFEDYHHFPLTFASYPGEKAITDKADSVCGGDAFTAFDGVDYESSELGLTYLYPTAESWQAGDRMVDCVVAAEAGKSTGSYRGTSK